MGAIAPLTVVARAVHEAPTPPPLMASEEAAPDHRDSTMFMKVKSPPGEDALPRRRQPVARCTERKPKLGKAARQFCDVSDRIEVNLGPIGMVEVDALEYVHGGVSPARPVPCVEHRTIGIGLT